MAHKIRRIGPFVLTLATLVALTALFAPSPDEVAAATYVDPWWVNNSTTPECPACSGCGCPRPPEWSADGVSHRTGELRVSFDLLGTPGMVEDNRFALLWRSEISGLSQFGNGMVAMFEWTLKKVDNANIDVRRPDGLIERWTKSGGTWYTSDCGITATLTDLGSGIYERRDKYGYKVKWGANGMPDAYTDPNGNQDTPVYNSSYQLTGYTDDRGKAYTISHNASGFVASIKDAANRQWDLGYDGNGNLITIDLPATPDQPSGSTITVTYDSEDRITGVQDGRGNQVTTYAWVGTSRAVDKVTIDGSDINFSYSSGRTDVTDRNGHVSRYHYTGRDITRTDMWVGASAKFATEYTYSGSSVVTIVKPRGNRMDMTYDGDDNMLELREKETDTASTSPSDIVRTWTYSNQRVASYTDPAGETTTYERNTAGNVTKIIFPVVTNPEAQAAEKRFEYNAYGQVTKEIDEEGGVVERSYYGVGTSFGLLEKIAVDPAGLNLETTFTYDAAGNVATTTDPNGNTITSTWDDRRRLTDIRFSTPALRRFKYAYDANGNVVEKNVENLDKDGASVVANPWFTTTYTYSPENQVLTITDEIDDVDTRTLTFEYDANGNRSRVIKPEGNKVTWAYNERNLVSSRTTGEGTSDASTATFVYDDNGNMLSATNGRGHQAQYQHDLFDRLVRSTDPLGHYVTRELDASGRLQKLKHSDVNNLVLAQRELFYDARGRVWKSADLRIEPGATHPDAVTTLARYKNGTLKKVTDARGHETTYGYDTAWRRTRATDALGNESLWILDGNGNHIAWSEEEVDGATSVIHDFEATYDALDRRLTQTSISRTDGTVRRTTSYGFDSRSNVVWLKNRKGDPTRFTFDAAGRMVTKEVALTLGSTEEEFLTSLRVDWSYDDNSRLLSHTDDAGNATTWEYDALDRPKKMVFPSLAMSQYVYDASGNVIEVTDGAGNVVTEAYDANNQRISRSVVPAAGFIGTTSESYTYDGMGRLLSAADNDYKVELSYTTIGFASMVYEDRQSFVGQAARTKTVRTGYDAAGNKVSELYPSGLDLDYAWTDVNELASVSDGTNLIASFAYVGARRKSVTFQNGTSASYSYSGFRNEVDRIHHLTSGSNSIVDLQYGYDANHRKLYERFGGASASGDAFEYDRAGRLTAAWVGSADVVTPSTAAYIKKVEYAMDDDGNRTAVVVTPYGQSAVTTTFAKNNLNQYTAVGGVSQTHDANGNLTFDGTYSYEYDYRGLLCRVKQGSLTVAEYRYDALGRRVEKSDQASIERYVYSGHETVSVYDGTDVWLRDFVFGNTIDEVLMLRQADVLDYDSDGNTSEVARSFYHRNALGSIMAITEMDGDVAASYLYDAYGAVTISRNGQVQPDDPLGQPWAYTGRFHDDETGLYYYRARHYQPSTGRFLQRDPLLYEPGSNLYEYVSSDPINYRDPLGLKGEACEDCAKKNKHIPGKTGFTPKPPPTTPRSKAVHGKMQVINDPKAGCAIGSLVEFPGIGVKNTCTYQIVRVKIYYCLMSGTDPKHCIKAADTQGWQPDPGTPGYGMQPGVFPPGMKSDLPQWDITTGAALNGIRMLAAAARKAGDVDPNKAWLRLMYCFEGKTYTYDMDDCKLISYFEWYKVYNYEMKADGRTVTLENTSASHYPKTGKPRPAAGFHVGQGEIGKGSIADRRCSEGQDKAINK